ncbi:MAG: UvrD-helicase domain-containing protein [Cetobacterium sp.]
MTEEMKSIIETSDRHIIVESRAGSGKSTTIKEYIKAHPNERILYLVFSAEMKREAERSFKGLGNCEIKTIHSLAYRWWVGSNRNTRYLGMDNLQIMKQLRDTSQLEIRSILSKYKLEYEDLQKIYFYYNMFLCSDKKDCSELSLVREEDKVYLFYSQRLYEYHRDNYVPVPHNFYLKQFSLTNPTLNGFSTICLDECQDFNLASLNIITAKNLDKKVIAVGDSAQAIFNFMHCKNALKILKNKYGFKEYKLTMSFRVSNTVAKMCSRLLEWFYEEDMSFDGVNQTKITNIDVDCVDEQVTILSRTRMGALLEVLSILDTRSDAKFYYYGGLEKYDLDKVEKMMQYDGFLFIDNNRYHVNTLRKMMKEGLDDPIIRGVVSRYDFIKKHKNCLGLLRGSETKNIKEADFCMNTLHGCKGSTYEIVKLANDIGGVSALKEKYADMKEANNEFKVSETENSLNLLYVGLSRATKYLDIGKAFVKEDKLGTSEDLMDVLDSK